MMAVSRVFVAVKRALRRVGGPWLPMGLIVLVVAGQLTAPWTASAEEKRNFAYPYDWVYKAAYRLLKIDMECPIEEADKDSGFIMFRYTYQNVESVASIELSDLTNEDEGYSVNSRVKMKKLPSWVEADLLDQLEAKLQDEYGEPPQLKKKEPPAPAEDEEDESADEAE